MKACECINTDFFDIIATLEQPSVVPSKKSTARPTCRAYLAIFRYAFYPECKKIILHPAFYYMNKYNLFSGNTIYHF